MFARLTFSLLASLLTLHQAAAQPVQARCKFIQSGSLPLSYHGQDLTLATAGNINGVPAVIALDTGATGSVITRFGADRRGLRMSPSAELADGIGGTSRMYTVPVRNFDVGPMRSSGRGEMKMIDQTGGRPDFDAIAGASLLLQADVELALAEKTASFYHGENCRDAFLAYWDANAVQVALLKTESGLPLVEVELDGLRLRALIDSGADSSTVSLKALDKLGLAAGSPGLETLGYATGIGGMRMTTYRYRFKNFSIGHEQIQHPELIVSEQLPASFQLILGRDFLRAHRVLLAPSQGKAYLSYLGGVPFDGGRPDGWLLKEGKAGNSHAQYRLALAAATPAEGRAWMEQAIAAGNPLALRHRAAYDERMGRLAEAIALRRQALQADPHDLPAQLDLFTVRVKAGQAPSAREDLARAVEHRYDPHWPRPAVDYYLGKTSLGKLLEAAGPQHRCEAVGYAAALWEARGDAAAPERASIASMGKDCQG